MMTTTRIWEIRENDHREYHMTYASAVLALLERGYALRRDAAPDENTTGWLTIEAGFFPAQDAFIGWIDAKGRCPACESIEIGK